MTFLVSTRLPSRVRDDIRIASDALGILATDFTDGMPIPPATIALVGALPAGARRVPAELARLASRSTLRIVLCAAEPMVRPVTTLLGGRVILISPPLEPQRLRWALRAAAAGGAEVVSATGDAGQSLGSEWWLAWARHPEHPAAVEAVESAIELTAALGPGVTAAAAEQAGDFIRAATDDDVLERDLTATFEDAAVVRLATTLGEWVLYWPAAAGDLWLCSPWRAPARWCLSRAIAASGRRLLRAPAFPHDVLIACDHGPAAVEIAATAESGALEAYAALRALAAGTPLVGAVVEAR